MDALVWRLWPEAKIFTEDASRDVTADYEKAIRDGVNLLPGNNLDRYLAEEAYGKEQRPLLNPEQDVSNTEIDESYERGR